MKTEIFFKFKICLFSSACRMLLRSIFNFKCGYFENSRFGHFSYLEVGLVTFNFKNDKIFGLFKTFQHGNFFIGPLVFAVKMLENEAILQNCNFVPNWKFLKISNFFIKNSQCPMKKLSRATNFQNCPENLFFFEVKKLLNSF